MSTAGGLPRLSRLTWVAIAWLIGFGLECWLQPGPWVWTVAVLLLPLVVWACFLLARSYRPPALYADYGGRRLTTPAITPYVLFSVSLFAALVVVGGWWSHVRRPGTQLQIGRLAPSDDDQTQLVRVRAALVSITPMVRLPERHLFESFRFSDSVYRFVVAVDSYRRDDDWHPMGGRLVCDLSVPVQPIAEDASSAAALPPVPPFPASIGQRLELFGKLSLPPPAKNPGQFDHRWNLWLSGFDAELALNDVRQIRTLDAPRPWSSWGWRLRDHFKFLLRQHLPAEQHPMAAAILLGDRSLLGSELRQQYAATGTVHVLAISGLHLGILAGTLLWFGRWSFVPHAPLYLATISLVLFYAWLVEFRPPIVRAAILTTAMCLATLLGRRAFSVHSLSVAFLVVFLLQPHQLAEPGTQLSFLAVAAIVWFVGNRSLSTPDPFRELVRSQQTERRRAALHLLGLVRDAYLCGVVVFLICLPLVVHYFNLCAWIGLVINPLVILPMTLALLSGFAVFFLSPISPAVADASGWLCSTSLSVMDQIISWAYQVPGSYVWVTSPGAVWIVVWYLWCLILVVVPNTRLPWSARVASSILLLTLAYLCPWPKTPDRADVNSDDSPLTLTFVDVGHGNAVVLRTPDQHVVVFDAGSFPSARQAGNRIGGVLLAHGIQKVDYLVISHADLDHYNGVPELLRRFSVRQFVGPPGLFAEPSPYVQSLQTIVNQSGIPQRWVIAGDVLCQGDEWAIRVLSPQAEPYRDGDNSNSLVLEVSYGASRILLTADVEGEGLRDLLACPPDDYQVVQVPHHGSHNSQPAAVAAWAGAPLAIVSASSLRVPAVTRSAYEQAGSRVLVTDEVGAVLLAVFPDGRVACRTYLERPWPTR